MIENNWLDRYLFSNDPQSDLRLDVMTRHLHFFM